MSKRKDSNRKGCKFCRFLGHFLKGMLILMLGVFIGIHWKVIRALVEGKKLPKVPKNHCCGWCQRKIQELIRKK